MEKPNYFGFQTIVDGSEIDKSNENVSKPATDFVSFLREQTNKNLHLNMYSDKINNMFTSKLLFRFKYLSKEETADILSKCVVTIKDDVVLLNKPNGIVVEGDNSQGYSILDVLPQLSKLLNLKNLYIVHRLDRNTTGALLLATTAETAYLLKDAFKRRQIRKNYLCLTHGVPYPKEGIIDFPFREENIDGNILITPDIKYINKRERKIGEISAVCTTYRTLWDNYNVALVQCSMVCGVKHQIRAHLAYGLDTPIIGDHKYAWFIENKKFPIMPQILSPPTLVGLKMEETKTRHIPIHLHAHQILINDANNPNCDPSGVRLKPMDLHVFLPKFFVDSLRKLKLFDQKLLKLALKHVF